MVKKSHNLQIWHHHLNFSVHLHITMRGFFFLFRFFFLSCILCWVCACVIELLHFLDSEKLNYVRKQYLNKQTLIGISFFFLSLSFISFFFFSSDINFYSEKVVILKCMNFWICSRLHFSFLKWINYFYFVFFLFVRFLLFFFFFL